MIDHHIHIGQFNEVYYDAFEVFSAIEKSSFETSIFELHYSSTSSCRFDVELSKIEEEIAYAQSFESDILKIRPYLWFVPKYAKEGISIKSAMGTFDYCGIKLHPYGQNWDFHNPIHKKCLEEIFSYSSESKKSILIHTGIDDCCRPSRFEEYFKNFPNSQIILAHSRPVEETILMMRKYPNVKCDISFCSKIELEKLSDFEKSTNLNNKILFGTDFPISHYVNKFNGIKTTLAEQYRKDCRNLFIHSSKFPSSNKIML